MADYGITINSRFKPFSFERYIQPYQIYGQAYKEQEDILNALETEAGQWEQKINQTSDPIAAEQYKRYADDLRTQAESLATQGLSPSSRRSILEMKRRYATEINPIREAIERRRALAEEQRKLYNQDQSLRFSNDWSKAYITQGDSTIGTIDALLDNPELSYESLSGKDIVNRVATMAKPLAESIMRNPTYSKILGGQYFQEKLQQGYTPEQIIMEATGNSNAPKELQNIRNTILSQIANNAAFDEDWANTYINQGMYQAIGSSKYNLVKNANFIDKETTERLQLARDEFNAKYEPDGNGGYRLRTPSVVPTPDGGALDTKKNILYDKEGNVKAVGTEAVNKVLGGGSNNNDKLPFTMLDYTGGGFNTPGTTDEFSVEDSYIYDKEKLTPRQRQKLEKDLLLYGLTIDDVDIYEDRDIFSRNHYRIVPKGHNAKGEKIEDLNFNE